MAEETKEPKVYIVSAEQLQALKAARSPEIHSTVSAIESQTIGSIPARLRDQAASAKGQISEKYRAALEQAAKQLDEAKAAGAAKVEEAKGAHSSE